MSLYKSSNFQIWPFFLDINELPPHLRGKQEYMLLAGLAFGTEKPVPNLLLRPINEEFKLLKKGINVSVPNSDSPVTV